MYTWIYSISSRDMGFLWNRAGTSSRTETVVERGVGDDDEEVLMGDGLDITAKK